MRVPAGLVDGAASRPDRSLPVEASLGSLRYRCKLNRQALPSPCAASTNRQLPAHVTIFRRNADWSARVHRLCHFCDDCGRLGSHPALGRAIPILRHRGYCLGFPSKEAYLLERRKIKRGLPGRSERIRTSGPRVPNTVLYQAELHSEAGALHTPPPRWRQAGLGVILQFAAETPPIALCARLHSGQIAPSARLGTGPFAESEIMS